MTELLSSQFYCSAASRLRNEACFGTGVTADIWLLIECPEPWGRIAVAESTMPQTVKDHIKCLTRQSKRIRTQLIKQEPRTGWPHKVYFAYTTESNPLIYEAEIGSYDDLLKLDPDKLIDRALPFEHSLVTHPLFLVCTHGRHDKCCAKFGYATYKLMHEIAPECVWQTSHVGGDRFASNVISFPTGVYYGHVDDAAAAAMITAENNGEILLEKYRGRTCFGKFAQVAEYFIRRESGLRTTASLRREWVRSNEEKTEWTSLFSSPADNAQHIVRFTKRPAPHKAMLTCHATEEKTPVEYHLLEYTREVNADI